jgi:hypothetical protein
VSRFRTGTSLETHATIWTGEINVNFGGVPIGADRDPDWSGIHRSLQDLRLFFEAFRFRADTEPPSFDRCALPGPCAMVRSRHVRFLDPRAKRGSTCVSDKDARPTPPAPRRRGCCCERLIHATDTAFSSAPRRHRDRRGHRSRLSRRRRSSRVRGRPIRHTAQRPGRTTLRRPSRIGRHGPGYLDTKRAIFTGFVPGWDRIFVEGDIDWRLVSWGGVLIDDRPYDTTDEPCNCIPAADNPEVETAEEATWLARTTTSSSASS